MTDGTNPRSVNDHQRIMPKKDDFGKIGHAEKRWAEGWFVDLYATPLYYTSTMTGNETFTDPLTLMKVYFLDPNGANRNFNPSGSFNAGFVAFVKNVNRVGYHIVFDSTVSAQIIAPGELGIMLYNGSVWL